MGMKSSPAIDHQLRAVLWHHFLICSKVSLLTALVLGIHLGSHFLPSCTIPSSQYWACLLQEPQPPQLFSHRLRPCPTISRSYLPNIPQLYALEMGSP